MRQGQTSKLLFLGVIATVLTVAAFFEQIVQLKHTLLAWALTGVTLNNGTTSVPFGTDLTSQTVSLTPDTGAYDWTVNGAHLMKLNVPFDAGGTISDLSGNALVGTPSGGPTYTTVGCQVGGCMSFDGVDDVISFGDVSSVEGQSALSFGAWVYPTEYAQSTSAFDLRTIVTKGEIGADNTSTFWSFFQGDNASSYIFACAFDTTAGFPGLQINAPTYFPLNTWTHFMCTWTAGGPPRVYVNGVVAQTGPTLNGTTINTPNPLYIGFSNNSTDDKFKGKIDEVQIFARGLSSDQVVQVYNDGLAGLGGPTEIKAADTSAGQVWDLDIRPITTAGSIGSLVASSNTVTLTGAVVDWYPLSPVFGTVGNDISITAVNQDTVYMAYLGLPSNTNLYFAKSEFGGSYEVGAGTLTSGWDGLQIPGATASWLDMDAADTNTIYVAYYDTVSTIRLAKSIDGGDNWTLSAITTDTDAFDFDLDVVDANTLFLASTGPAGSRVFSSIDGGANWSAGVDIDAINSNRKPRLSAFDANNVFVSYLDENNAICPGSGVASAYSSNGGASWSLSCIFNGATPNHYHAIDAVSATSAVVVAMTGGQAVVDFAITTNSGSSWTPTTVESGTVFSYPDISSADGTNIYISYRDPTIGCCGRLKIAESSNAGASWTVTQVDPSYSMTSQPSSIFALDAVNVYAAYREGGIRFIRHLYESPAVGGYTADNVVPLAQVTPAMDGSGDITINFKMRDGESHPSYAAFVAFSTDGGVNFDYFQPFSPAFSGGFPNNNGARYLTAPTFASAPSYSFVLDTKHPDVLALNTIDDTDIVFRFNPSDGFDFSSVDTQTEQFTIDNKSPIPSVIANLSTRPSAGATQVSITGSFTETHPGSNNCQAAVNGGALGALTACGSGATAGPTLVPVGVTLDGDDVVTAASISHTDTWGNNGTNQNPGDRVIVSYFEDGLSAGNLGFARSSIGDITQFTNSIIDSTVASGYWTNIGYANATTMFASYYLAPGDFYQGTLYVAKSTDSGDNWTLTQVDNTIGTGQFSDIVIVDTNNVFISYLNRIPASSSNNDSDLRFASTTNGGGSWTTTIVDSSGDTGFNTSIDAIDANTIFISYYRRTSGDLMFAKSTNGGGSWSTMTVASSGNVGQYTAIDAVDASTVYITYYDVTNADYRLAKSIDGGSNWTTSIIDATGDSGKYSNFVAVDASTLFGVYWYATNDDVYFASSTNGGSSWTTGFVADGGFQYKGIAATDANNVYITYSGNSGLQMSYSSDAGANWNIVVLDNNASGTYSDIDIRPVDLLTATGVAPYTPSAPTVGIVDPITAHVTINPHVSEVGTVQYAIRVIGGGTNYVQSGGTLGASPFFQTYTAWGGASGIDVTGLVTPPYSFTVVGRNPNADQPQGSFSSAASFNPGGNSAPSAPTALFSNNSSAQLGSTNPTGLTSATPVFSALCNDADAGDILNKYRVQVSTVNNFATTVWDSGALGTSMSNCTAGSRSQNITFGGAPLPQDGTTYYWRIKFFDDEPSEGVFSETVSTNTFTMATSGGGGGGGGTSVQRLVQLNTIAAPTIGPVSVVSPSAVRFQWSYGDTANILGFRLINDLEAVAVLVENPNARATDEQLLPHNTLIRGRKVVAYNNSGESTPSAVYPDAYTFMIPVTPKVVSREGRDLRVAIKETVNNITTGQSGIQFELISVGTTGTAGVIQSPWLQAGEYVFETLEPGTSYLLRSRARNFIGIETIWSNTISVPVTDVMPSAPQLSVGLQLTSNDGQSLDQPLNPNSVLSVEMTVVNNGQGTAENTLLTLPIPTYINVIPGTLSVDGRKQSDAADGDTAQAANGAVSAIWSDLSFGFGHAVRFELGFDTQAIVQEYVGRIEEISPLETETQRLERAIAQAFSAANPQITLQAQASHSGDSEPVYSQPQQIEPDVDVLMSPQPMPTPIQTVNDPEIMGNEPASPPPTPQQVQIIQQVLQQQFPQPGTQTSQPPIPQGDTTSSFDGGSFSVSTTSGTNQLTMTGHATANGGMIQFVGTTSQPFAVVTLIINGSTTVIATADINGNWQTFVSAEQIGLQPGQSGTVTVEAIAASGDIQSERVIISQVVVSREANQSLTADFTPLVSAAGPVRLLQTVTQTLQKNEPAVQTTLAVSAPVVIASSVPLWGYLPYAPTLFYHFLGLVFGSAARRKKKDNADTFGVVYDSITKLPLPLAIVRIYDRATNKLVTTTVTDKLGRYDVLLPAGQYRVEVGKPQYQFPSSIVTTPMDGVYSRVYSEQAGMTIVAGTSAVPHVPLDPINVKRQWEMAFGLRKLWLGFQRAGNHLATPLMLVGLVTALGMVYASPARSANWIMAVLYAATLAAQSKLKPKILKAWGVVYDIATDAILPLVTIQLIEPAGSKVVTSRLTDYEGRFTFLPEPGQYIVKASKPGFTQVTEVVQGYSDRQPMPPQVHIEKPNQRIAGDIAMKQNSP